MLLTTEPLFHDSWYAYLLLRARVFRYCHGPVLAYTCNVVS